MTNLRVYVTEIKFVHSFIPFIHSIVKKNSTMNAKKTNHLFGLITQNWVTIDRARDMYLRYRQLNYSELPSLTHLASISGSYAFMCKPHAYWPFHLVIIIEALFPCTC